MFVHVRVCYGLVLPLPAIRIPCRLLQSTSGTHCCFPPLRGLRFLGGESTRATVNISIIPIQHPMPIPKMVLVPIILTVAHMSHGKKTHHIQPGSPLRRIPSNPHITPSLGVFAMAQMLLGMLASPSKHGFLYQVSQNRGYLDALGSILGDPKQPTVGLISRLQGPNQVLSIWEFPKIGGPNIKYRPEIVGLLLYVHPRRTPENLWQQPYALSVWDPGIPEVHLQVRGDRAIFRGITVASPACTCEFV